MPVYPQANMIAFIDAYCNNSTVYTIISLMARKFGFIPRYLFEVEKDANESASKYQKQLKSFNPNISAQRLKNMLSKAYQDKVDEQNPLQNLLMQPNPLQGQDAYYQSIYTFKKLTGNAFVWLNRNVDDTIEGSDRLNYPIMSMWVLPSQYVTLVVDRSIFPADIIGYQFWGSGGIPIFLPKEDILHWKDPNPLYDSYNFQQLYGLSPLYPGMKLISQDDAARDAAVAMFQNGGARGVLYNESFDNLTEKQVAQADKAIDTKINNKAMKSAVAQLPGKWGYLFTGESAVDMQLMEAQDRTFQRICNLLGCNPQLFDTQTTFNNVEQARKDLITNAICPDACSFRDEENRVLLQAFGYTQDQYCIDIDVTDLPELQDDMEKLTARVMSNWTLSVDEKREELGFDPIGGPEGETRFIPTTLTTMEDAIIPTAGLTDPGSGFGDNADSGGQVPDPRAGQAGAGNNKDLPSGQDVPKISPGWLALKNRIMVQDKRPSK